MHHRLLVAGLIVGQQVGLFEERLAHSGDVAVAEDAKAAVDETLLHTVALRELRREKPHQGLRHRQTRHRRFSATIAAAASTAWATSPSRG